MPGKELGAREKRRQQGMKEIADHKAKVEKEHGTEGNPRADRAYELAWKYGHSCGFHEVERHYSDMVELIEVCKKCQWKEPAITLAGAYWRMQKLNKTCLDDDGEVEMEHLSGLAKWAEDKIRALQAVETSSHGKVRLAPEDMQRHECCACLELFTPWPDGDEMNTILCRACALKERL